ncbi:MAG TPA: glycosyltransferase [bacterium]|nr:glycosyltransferase [bacterium]
MRVALVHDWLTGMRGGEKVLEELCHLYPDAPLFTLLHVPGSVSSVIESRRIVSTGLTRIPGIARHYRRFLPLFPRLIESLDLTGFELVVSTSSCVAKGARAAAGARHVSYVHSPMRYVWDRYHDYFGAGRAGPLTRGAMAVFREPLRRWDRRTADRVDRYLANSAFVARRIRDCYDRDATVVPPPVDAEHFRPTGDGPGDEWLVVSAFVPYKRIEVAVEAAAIAGVPLAIVGKGPEEARLRELAGPRVRFLGWVDDRELVRLYSSCRGLLFPGVEDFGITPLEAMACGRPVVAFAEGGALETVVGALWEGDPDGAARAATGLFVREQTPRAFARAILALERTPELVSPVDCRDRALEFGRPRFRERLRSILTSEGEASILPG